MKKKVFDIQMFGTTITTSNTATFGKRLNETNAHMYYDMTLKDAIYDEYKLEKYFDTITLPENNGKQMGFRKRGKYIITGDKALVEGVIPDEDSPMETYEYKVNLGDFGGYITFTDQVDIYSIDKGESTALQRNQGYAVGELFQQKAYTILKSTKNVWFAGASTVTDMSTMLGSASALDLDEFRKIKTFLQRNKVKPYDNGDYLVVISPEVAETLLSLAKDNSKFTFIEIANYQQNTAPLFDGEIGRWNGFRFVVDNVIHAYNAENPSVHACLILGKYNGEKGAKLVKLAGYGEPKSIIKPVTSGGAKENPLNQIGSIGWKCMGWGGCVLYAEAVMLYLCSADAVKEDVFVEKERANFTKGYDKNGNAITATPKVVINKEAKTEE